MRSVSCGHCATFSLEYDDDDAAAEGVREAAAAGVGTRPRPRRGMVLAAAALAPRAVRTFDAEVRGAPATVRAVREGDSWMTAMENNCRQAALVAAAVQERDASGRDVLRVTFRFVHRSQVVTVGSAFVLHDESFARWGVGTVVAASPGRGSYKT